MRSPSWFRVIFFISIQPVLFLYELGMMFSVQHVWCVLACALFFVKASSVDLDWF